MGFNVGHGFRLHSSDLSDVDALLRRFRAELKPLHKRGLAAVCGEIAVDHIDLACCAPLLPGGKRHEVTDPITKAWTEIVTKAQDFISDFGPETATRHVRGRFIQFALDGRFMEPDIDDLIGDGAARFLAEASAVDPLVMDRTRESSARPLSSAWNEVSERTRRIVRSGFRDMDVDFGFEVSLVLYDNRIYGIMHCDRAAWRQLWLAQPEVEAYPWWDNEHPDWISEQDWEARGREWKAALGPASVPSLVGMQASLTNPIRSLRREDVPMVMEECPSFGRRLGKRAIELVRDRWLRDRRRQIGNPPDEEPWANYHNLGRLIFEFEDWLRTPDGEHAVTLAKAEIEPLLIRELTIDILLNGVPEASPHEEAQRLR